MKHAKEYEIMWFGELIINKKGNYILKDIHFPPQINSFGLVTTHDKKFPKWFFEQFTKKQKHKNIRLHGHTHPFFNTHPSITDMQHVETFLKESKDYFIQLIMSNNFTPSCILYTDTEYSELEIIWNYTMKMKKVLREVMHIESDKT